MEGTTPVFGRAMKLGLPLIRVRYVRYLPITSVQVGHQLKRTTGVMTPVPDSSVHQHAHDICIFRMHLIIGPSQDLHLSFFDCWVPPAYYIASLYLYTLRLCEHLRHPSHMGSITNQGRPQEAKAEMGSIQQLFIGQCVAQ